MMMRWWGKEKKKKSCVAGLSKLPSTADNDRQTEGLLQFSLHPQGVYSSQETPFILPSLSESWGQQTLIGIESVPKRLASIQWRIRQARFSIFSLDRRRRGTKGGVPGSQTLESHCGNPVAVFLKPFLPQLTRAPSFIFRDFGYTLFFKAIVRTKSISSGFESENGNGLRDYHGPQLLPRTKTELGPEEEGQLCLGGRMRHEEVDFK